MPSLEFENLPLMEVTCNLILGEPLDVSFDTISAIRHSVRDLLPHALQVFSGLGSPTSPFALVVGSSPGATFGDPEGTILSIAPERVSASWRRRSNEAQYVRFPKLLGSLERVAREVDLDKTVIVNMAYANLATIEEVSVWDLVSGEAWPPITNGRIKDYNVAWELESGIEFRLQVTPQQEAFLITTSAGMRIAGSWSDAVGRIHETLQVEFARLITDKAKEVWKWRQA